MVTRRTFLALAAPLLLGAARPSVDRRALAVRRSPHPKPRPGITGAKVLTAEQLKDSPALVPLFDGIRAIPQIVDGIRCNCGCGSMAGYYSLLSCYEGDAMARGCPICQGQGRLAIRLAKEGKSLDDIRLAIDAQFG